MNAMNNATNAVLENDEYPLFLQMIIRRWKEANSKRDWLNVCYICHGAFMILTNLMDTELSEELKLLSDIAEEYSHDYLV